MSMTGLLLGAGASCDIGMPLASELTKELTTWLTPAKLKWLNSRWQQQGDGYSEATIDDFARILTMDNMTYEHMMGYLEVQRDRIRARSQEYHGLRTFLSEMTYVLLRDRHVLNESFITRNIRYLEGIETLVGMCRPLWVFSLNHDLAMECLAAQNAIPIRYGFGKEAVRLPRRDISGTAIGEIEARVTRRSQLESHALDFFKSGEEGINLLKIHGSLDEFAFNDGQDLLKLVPDQVNISGVISVLRDVNEEVRYIDPSWPGGVVKTVNEIAYADDQGEMQFLRRTPLGGAFKFQERFDQSVPKELLSYFTLRLGYLTKLICIGYGFRDPHVNEVIRNWLEQDVERQLEIVDPYVEGVPMELLHLSTQIGLVKVEAIDYLDDIAGISRTQSEVIDRQLAALFRKMPRHEVGQMMEQYMNRRRHGVVNRMVEWTKTLPWKNGNIDLDELGITMEEFLERAQQEVPMPSPEESLEDFLKQATASR